MSTGAEALAHFVCNGTHVGAGSDAGTKARAVGIDREDGEFLDFDLHGLEHYLFLFSCQLVGGDAVDFFGRERRRDLLDQAEESGGEILEVIESGGGGLRVADWV